MPIRYKVIDAESRTSCFCITDSTEIEYPLNKVVHKKPGSVGIFLFDTRENAEKFIRRHKSKENPVFPWKVIRVKTIGRGKKLVWRPLVFSNTMFKLAPRLIKKYSSFVSKEIDGYSKLKNYSSKIPKEIIGKLYYENDGTMVYDSVIPLD